MERRTISRKRKCEHGRQMNVCLLCQGPSICQHMKRRTRCVQCGGGSLCTHLKRKDKCPICAGMRECHFQNGDTGLPEQHRQTFDSQVPVSQCDPPAHVWDRSKSSVVAHFYTQRPSASSSATQGAHVYASHAATNQGARFYGPHSASSSSANQGAHLYAPHPAASSSVTQGTRLCAPHPAASSSANQGANMRLLNVLPSSTSHDVSCVPVAYPLIPRYVVASGALSSVGADNASVQSARSDNGVDPIGRSFSADNSFGTGSTMSMDNSVGSKNNSFGSFREGGGFREGGSFRESGSFRKGGSFREGGSFLSAAGQGGRFDPRGVGGFLTGRGVTSDGSLEKLNEDGLLHGPLALDAPGNRYESSNAGASFLAEALHYYTSCDNESLGSRRFEGSRN